MQGPLKTVIRNKTDKMLIYTTFPRIYVDAFGECVLDFDPFTRWSDGNALETLLIDVRRGAAQIVYMVDPLYATAGSSPNMVFLSVNAEARANNTVIKPKVQSASTKHPQHPEKVGIPFGMLPGEDAEKDPKTGTLGDGKSSNPTAIQNAEIVKKVADIRPETAVDLSENATSRAKEAVTLTPITDEEIAQKTAEAAATVTPKRGRKKKEVIQL